MKRLHTIVIFLLVGAVSISGQQHYESIEQSILSNNAGLKAMHGRMQAQQTQNHVGLTLDDPQIEFNHFFAPHTPDGRHYRNDLNITQQFDYATLFGLKRKMARTQDELASLEYDAEKLQLILNTRQTIVGIIYYNRCLACHRDDEQVLLQAVENTRKAYEAGEINLLQLNKMQLLLTNLQSIIAEEESARRVYIHQLSGLNGGTELSVADMEYPDFSVASLSRFALLQQFTDTQEQNIQLQQRTTRSQSIPRLTLGYVSEVSTEEKFRGFTIGMNVPLWSNKNKQKAAHYQRVAQGLETAAQLQQLNQQKQELEIRSVGLKAQTAQLQRSLQQYASADILYKAYLRGDVSAGEFYTEFLAEMDLHHRASQLERDYQQTLAELSVF